MKPTTSNPLTLYLSISQTLQTFQTSNLSNLLIYQSLKLFKLQTSNSSNLTPESVNHITFSKNYVITLPVKNPIFVN
jgi:hypothetical protein